MTDWKTNDRFKNRFRKPRDGRTGRYTAHETHPQDAEEDPNSEEEESCEEESDLTTASERETDLLASLVEELEETLDVQDVEDLREIKCKKGSDNARFVFSVYHSHGNKFERFRPFLCLIRRIQIEFRRRGN